MSILRTSILNAKQQNSINFASDSITEDDSAAIDHSEADNSALSEAINDLNLSLLQEADPEFRTLIDEDLHESIYQDDKPDYSDLIETDDKRADNLLDSPLSSPEPSPGKGRQDNTRKNFALSSPEHSPSKGKQDKIRKNFSLKKNTLASSPKRGYQEATYRQVRSTIPPRGRGNYLSSLSSKQAPKKKNQSFGLTSTAEMVLSANKVEIKDLQSQIFYLQSQLKECRTENKTLKTIQTRQERELNGIQEGKADIPSLLKSHKAELKALQTTLNTTRHDMKECQRDLRNRNDEMTRKEMRIRELTALLNAKDRMLCHKDETHAKNITVLNDKIKSLEYDLENKNVLYNQMKNEFYRLKAQRKDFEAPYRYLDSQAFKRTHANVATQTSPGDFDSSSNPNGSPRLSKSKSIDDSHSISMGDMEDSPGSTSPKKVSFDESAEKQDKTRTGAATKGPDVRRAKISSLAKFSPVKKKVDFKSAPYSARYEAPKREPKISIPDKAVTAMPKYSSPRSTKNFGAEIVKEHVQPKAPDSNYKAISTFSSGLPNIGFKDNSTRYFDKVDKSPIIPRDLVSDKSSARFFDKVDASPRLSDSSSTRYFDKVDASPRIGDSSIGTRFFDKVDASPRIGDSSINARFFDKVDTNSRLGGLVNDSSSARYFDKADTSARMSKYDSLRSKYNLGESPLEALPSDSSAPRFGGW